MNNGTELELLNQLNPEQAQAVRHPDGPLLVLAGAGSGKTRVLTYRIAYLLQTGAVAPHQILAVTFTNKAAAEMSDRVVSLVGDVGRGIWISTFHSACVRILRRDGEQIGVPKNFVIYDETDQLSLVKRLCKSLEITEENIEPKFFLWLMDQAKNRLQAPDSMADTIASGQRNTFLRLANAYEQALKEAGAVDFGDLIVKTYHLLCSKQDVRKYYQERFRHILVDEFQDTNRAQYLLLNALLGGHQNIFVVGDDDQSIYSWRGAEIANILHFDYDFPGTKKVILTQNYRSTKRILAAASDVVSVNKSRNPKQLQTHNPEGEKILHYRADDEFDEARFVVQTIADLRQSQKIQDYSEIAVFYRTNAQSRLIEDELRGAGLPYAVIGGTRFYDRKEIKDAIAYLRILINPADNVALLRILNVPTRGIGNQTIEKAVRLAEQLKVPILEGIRIGISGAQGKIFSAQVLKKLKLFLDTYDKLLILKDNTLYAEFQKKVLNDFGYIQDLQNQKRLEAEIRLENLNELFNAVQQFEKQFPDEDLGTFLEQVALISDPDLYDRKADVVSLMTLHCAKGLEFPVVFLIGMENGLFPHQRVLDSKTEMEEERRLCYVGFTRARKQLFVTSASMRRVYGMPQWNPVSSFLKTVHRDLLETISSRHIKGPQTDMFGSLPQKSTPKPSQWKGANQQFSQLPEYDEPVWSDDIDDPFPVGTRVRHEQFGEGQVLSCSGYGENLKISIHFDRGGVRNFRVQYAPIEKI